MWSSIILIRRLCRASHDWGIPVFLAKLDIRKAVDSVFQEAMVHQIEDDVAVRGGLVWEARAWITLPRAGEIQTHYRG